MHTWCLGGWGGWGGWGPGSIFWLMSVTPGQEKRSINALGVLDTESTTLTQYIILKYEILKLNSTVLPLSEGYISHYTTACPFTQG